jgi:DNA replication and repair protein RecF
VALTQWVKRLRLENFRNVEALTLDLSPRLNVLWGDNGQGKTSVLEALYLLLTSKSFRTERLREVRRDGSELTLVLGTVVEDGFERQQRVALTAKERSFALDGKAPTSLSQYALRSPVVVFHPGDLELVSGPASLRRRLLDRVALFSDPGAAEARLGYQRASRERQAVLLARGTSSPDLDVFEQLVARHGVALRRVRQRAVELLEEALIPAFRGLAAVELELQLAYEPGGSDDEREYARELYRRREGDRRRKSSDYGPSRDDVRLDINGRSARRQASQGQQRVLTLALKAAELQCIRSSRGVEPLLLLDDVSSELDPSRVGAVYDFVRASAGQVLVTTTRPDLFDLPEFADRERRDFQLRSGALLEARSID